MAENASIKETLRTPLYAEHVALGARMVPFAGWEMPLLYRGIIPEHLYTREKVSIFDICHMGEFEISGPDAESDLERLLTQSVKKIPAGGCAYGYLLAEDGGVKVLLYAANLASLSEKARGVVLTVKKGKTTKASFGLTLDRGLSAYVGKTPPAASKPYTLQVSFSEGKLKYSSAFVNLD